MPRNRITTIYPRDRHAMAALGRCGHVSHDQLGTYLRDKRISDYLKSGLLQKVVYAKPGDRAQDQACYKLTTKGREFCRHTLRMSEMYRPQSITHDMGVADRYFSLTQQERDSWQTETEARTLFEAHIEQLREQGDEERANELWDKLREGAISPPDAIYTNTQGVQVAFEVITNNYGEEEISEKLEFIEEMELSYSESRV